MVRRSAGPGEVAVSRSQLDRRTRIIEAANRLLSSSSYEQVQMTDVAQVAGVALATIYRYFGSKENLFSATDPSTAWTEPAEPPEAAAASEGQRMRRERIVDAAVRLLASSSYEKVQMNDVAEEAGVALGTVYRYFHSKEQLFAEALIRWAERFKEVFANRPSRAAKAGDRFVELYTRAFRAHRRNPNFYATYRTIELSTDAGAQASLRRLQELLNPVYRERLEPAVPDEVGKAVVFAANAVMEGLIVRIAAGALAPAEADELLTTSLRALVAGARTLV